VPRSIPMSLDNQPKSPLNMNYLLEALSSPRKRVHIVDLRRTSPRARFDRLNRGNMKRRVTASRETLNVTCYKSYNVENQTAQPL
jgi:hypothetical protein